jgi:hypothetical protein
MEEWFQVIVAVVTIELFGICAFAAGVIFGRRPSSVKMVGLPVPQPSTSSELTKNTPIGYVSDNKKLKEADKESV